MKKKERFANAIVEIHTLITINKDISKPKDISTIQPLKLAIQTNKKQKKQLKELLVKVQTTIK